MTTTLYGMPAVEVPNAKGECVPYLLTEAAPVLGETRAWTVTKPDGECYRVSEQVTGTWLCTCRDFFYRQRRNRSRRDMKCKHVDALAPADA